MASETPADFEPLTGHCGCKAITYSLTASPLIIHCCHCTRCQRETGSAFLLNLQLERTNLHITSPTQPVLITTPYASGGHPQLIARCPTCHIALYSHYGGNTAAAVVRVGTLDDASRARVRPDVHIYTSTKMEWVDLTAEVERGVPVYEEYYERGEVWGREALERRERMMSGSG